MTAIKRTYIDKVTLVISANKYKNAEHNKFTHE